jgi:hypothetical protein
VVPAAAEEVSDTWADPTVLAEMTGLRMRTDLRQAVARIVGARSLHVA